jgi:cell wall assembly regulator SMI1
MARRSSRRDGGSDSPAAALVRAGWDRIDRWCRAHLPGLLRTLNPGASPAQVAALERAIGRPLPAEVRESLTIHNGQADPTGFLFQLDLLDAETVAKEWALWSGLVAYNAEYRGRMTSYPAGAVALDYGNPDWVPLAKSAATGYLAVDLAPGPAGMAGQVITFGRREDVKCVLAVGWGEFLSSYAAFLEGGGLPAVHPDPEAWRDNFEPVFEGVTADGQEIVRNPLDVLVEWRKAGRWPVP